MRFSRTALIFVSIPITLFILGWILLAIMGSSTHYTYNVLELISEGLTNPIVVFEVGIVLLVAGAITQLSLVVFKSDSRKDPVAFLAGVTILIVFIIMFINLIFF